MWGGEVGRVGWGFDLGFLGGVGDKGDWGWAGLGRLVRRPVGPFGPVGQGGFLFLLLFFFVLPFIHFSFILVAL